MLLLVAAAIIVILVATGVVGGGSTLLTERRRPLLGGTGGPLAAVGAVVAVVMVLALLGVGVVGLGRGGGDHEAAHTGPAPSPKPPAEKAPPPAPKALAPPVGAVVGGTGVMLRGGGGPMALVDALEPGSVLRLTVAGLEPLTEGFVAQCALRAGQPQSCTNRFPVVVGADGAARFQYLVTDHVRSEGRCGPGDPPCALLVAAAGVRTVALTVFHGPAPRPGVVTVTPSAGLTEGDPVDVRLRAFPPTTPVRVAVCAVDRGCGRSQSVTAAGDGRALARVTVEGPGGVECGPRRRCAVVVTADAAMAPVSVALGFAAGPTAGYDAGRLALGLVVAALLSAAAVWLVRTGDWHPPPEATTPAMDAAVLEA